MEQPENTLLPDIENWTDVDLESLIPKLQVIFEIPTSDQNKDDSDVLNEVFARNKDEYIDVSPYVTLTQGDAAKALEMPSSTLRWKEATLDRPWPYREIMRIDKEIKAILETSAKRSKKMGKSEREFSLDESQLQFLRSLLNKRNEATRKVFIRKN